MLGRVAGRARPVSYTLGPEAGWRVAGWAGPVAHARHRRAEGLRLVSGWHTLRPVSDCAEGLGLWGQTRAGGQGLRQA